MLYFPAEQRGVMRKREKVTSPAPQNFKHNARTSKPPQLKGKVALFFSSFPCSLTHPTVKKEWSPGKMQIEYERNKIQNQSQKTKNEQLTST